MLETPDQIPILSPPLSELVLILYFFLRIMTTQNGNATSSDWDGRYYHVDQVLNNPGPRTEEAFQAGDAVSLGASALVCIVFSIIISFR